MPSALWLLRSPQPDRLPPRDRPRRAQPPDSRYLPRVGPRFLRGTLRSRCCGRPTSRAVAAAPHLGPPGHRRDRPHRAVPTSRPAWSAGRPVGCRSPQPRCVLPGRSWRPMPPRRGRPPRPSRFRRGWRPCARVRRPGHRSRPEERSTRPWSQLRPQPSQWPTRWPRHSQRPGVGPRWQLLRRRPSGMLRHGPGSRPHP